jgi:NADPH2:quinone reductase
LTASKAIDPTTVTGIEPVKASRLGERVFVLGCALVRAIQMSRFGGPEVLELVELERPSPNPDEVLIRVAMAGVNFADTHRRTDSYVARTTLPMVPGIEVAGVREDTGERVVALCGDGGYAEYALAARDRVFPVPGGVEDAAALAMLVQGCTAWHLYRTAGRVRDGESVVIHAAGGGVGSLAVQLARPLGAARVIASASTEPKLELARELGADRALLGAPDGLTERILAANDGRPVDVIFDSAGGPVFEQSLAALAPFGRIVTYGIASREQNQIRTGQLLRNSQAVVGFWLWHCLERPGMLGEALADLFARLSAGTLRALIGGVYPLAQAAQAQIDLAARSSTGKLVLDLTL